MTSQEPDEQADAWERMYNRVCEVLRYFGTENYLGDGDYWVLDDNYGWRETHVEVHNLNILAPRVIARLRTLTAKDANWQI